MIFRGTFLTVLKITEEVTIPGNVMSLLDSGPGIATLKWSEETCPSLSVQKLSNNLSYKASNL